MAVASPGPDLLVLDPLLPYSCLFAVLNTNQSFGANERSLSRAADHFGFAPTPSDILCIHLSLGVGAKQKWRTEREREMMG